MNMVPDRRGFTLIELLVVIVIIAILVALSLPVSNAVRERSKKVKATSDIGSLKMAWLAYEREYTTWPDIFAGTTERFSTGFQTLAGELDILTGDDESENPHKTRFVNLSDSDVNDSDQWVDPWGNPYKFMLDVDYSGVVEANSDGWQKDVAGSVVTWSRGPNESDSEDISDPEFDDIVSWDL